MTITKCIFHYWSLIRVIKIEANSVSFNSLPRQMYDSKFICLHLFFWLDLQSLVIPMSANHTFCFYLSQSGETSWKWKKNWGRRETSERHCRSVRRVLSFACIHTYCLLVIVTRKRSCGSQDHDDLVELTVKKKCLSHTGGSAKSENEALILTQTVTGLPVWHCAMQALVLQI